MDYEPAGPIDCAGRQPDWFSIQPGLFINRRSRGDGLTSASANSNDRCHQSGEEAVMVKYIICVTRKAGLSHEEFCTYWRDHHGPLVRGVPEFARHVRKYVQCHLVKGLLPLGSGGTYDGVAELWFDSVEDMQRAFSEPRYLEVIRPDEQKFVDSARLLAFITDENQMI